MRIGYIECFSGMSGDMMLGALLHAGVQPDLFHRAIRALGVEANVEIHAVNRGGISATKVDVVTAENAPDDAHVILDHSHHDHDHAHHDHSHHDQPDHTHSHVHSRSLSEIEQLISSAALDANVRELALRAFWLLGEAEAKVHNIPVEKIHFHEVGAVDAIVDIVCASAGCISLGVDRWICSPINTGGGTVQCAHGTMPVPAPATAELLKGARVYNSGINMELVTPTGAAMLRALPCEFCTLPEINVQQVGYGAGTRDVPRAANVVRLVIGESATDSADSDVVSVLETAVDDLTPEVIGYVIEQSLASGALDAMASPVQMKKNRPGHLLTVLCRPADADRMATFLLRETSALGLRIRQERRRVLQRRFETVTTVWGEVRVKLGYLNGEIANCAPEFEDCRRIAQDHGIPLKTVMQEAIRMCSVPRSQAAR